MATVMSPEEEKRLTKYGSYEVLSGARDEYIHLYSSLYSTF